MEKAEEYKPGRQIPKTSKLRNILDIVIIPAAVGGFLIYGIAHEAFQQLKRGYFYAIGAKCDRVEDDPDTSFSYYTRRD